MKPIDHIPSREDIERIHQAISPFIHNTPVLTSRALNGVSNAQLYFKCENLQKIGAFKIRGATAAILARVSMPNKVVAAHSSGNHAQALALAARTLGFKAHIVMPENAPVVKRKAVIGYGANVVTCGPTIESREKTLREVIQKTGAVEIHPFDDYDIIAGAATAAKELLTEIPDLDVVVAPIGGGGLMSGTILACRYFGNQVEAVGAEPQIVDDAKRSLQYGSIQKNKDINTIADGLRTHLCDKTFEIIQSGVQDIITVSEEEIKAAMRLIWERMKIIIEPSAAVPFAAILQQSRFENQKIGIILSGGNVDLSQIKTYFNTK